MNIRDMNREERDLLNLVLSEVLDMERTKDALEESTLSEFSDDRKMEIITVVETYLQHKVDKC